MLQQTQVSRVMGKYQEFLDIYPDFPALAQASLGEILSTWQGLGYNRRAKSLKLCAERVMDGYNGVLPDDIENLL
ncbi:MAG: A/G-specific adenine glycosylase, partial [Methanoregulaceae archaeon]|nr:A/G-specific adenine glycosylase [Methanoregulaceae archaeon]